jgi:DNA primase
MPGIDYSRLREEIHMEDVLRLLQYQPTLNRGDQWYGHCPLHESTAKHRTAFAIHLAKGCYYCHKCKSTGDHLQLWATITNRSLYRATIDLCHQLGREVPWIYRW